MENIKISEQQAKMMLETLPALVAKSLIIDIWKEKGFIKKTTVEEAEESWADIQRDCFINDNINSLRRYIDKLLNLARKQHSAIQELKAGK